MFTKRIIPCLDVNEGRVVKGINFVDLKDAGDPRTLLRGPQHLQNLWRAKRCLSSTAKNDGLHIRW